MLLFAPFAAAAPAGFTLLQCDEEEGASAAAACQSFDEWN